MLICPYEGLSNSYITENYIDRNIKVKLYVNNVMLCLAMLVRSYLTVRFALSFTRYKNPRSQRLCMVYGKEASWLYAIKCFMKDKPFPFLAASLCIPLVIGGYCLRLFERPLIFSSG
jgi:hypothetical protein